MASSHYCKMPWWIKLGYPDAFAVGKDGFFPRTGQVIKYYRGRKMNDKGKAWTQKDLAKTLGVTENTIRDIENRDTGMDFERRQFLCKLFGIPPVLLGITTAGEIDLLLEKQQESSDIVTLISTPSYTGHKLTIDTSEYGNMLTSLWEELYNTGSRSMTSAVTSLDALYRELPHTREGQEQIQLLLWGYHQFIARFLFSQQMYDAAIDHLDKALFFAEVLKNEELLALTFDRRGWIYREAGHLDKAREDYEKAKRYKNLPYNLTISILISAGEVEAEDTGADEEKKRAVIALIDRAGNILRTGHIEEDPYFLKLNQNDYHRHRSAALIKVGRNRDALAELKLIKHNSSYPYTQVAVRLLQAQAYFNCGKHERAASFAAYGLEMAQEINSKVSIARAATICQQLKQSSYKDSSDVARLDYLLSKQ